MSTATTKTMSTFADIREDLVRIDQGDKDAPGVLTHKLKLVRCPLFSPQHTHICWYHWG